MMRILPLASLFAAGILSAQTPPAQPADSRPAYEAAVIKPNTSGSGSSSSHGTKGQIVMVNNSLRSLVERGLNIKPFQLEGPDWMSNVSFDISAKYPPDITDADRTRMLRTLLEDRFGLKYHQSTKDLPGYALVIAKGGFKLKPLDAAGAANGPGSSTNSNGKDVKFQATAMTMSGLADYLARQTRNMVVDKTGLSGAFTFEMTWSAMAERAELKPGDPDPGPSLYTVLQEVTGLKLQPEKVPTMVYTVDSLERTPTDN